MKLIDKVIAVDVAIIGGGLAGLSTAYFLDLLGEEGVNVAIISKSSLGYGTSTYYSAGAFRCPVDGHSVEDYVTETLNAGRFVNRKHLVKLIALRSTDCIRSLEKLGLRFRSSRGYLRVMSDDALFPGKELMTALRRYVFSRPNAVFLENTHMLDITRDGNGVLSTICARSRGDYVVVKSKAVVLATGGAANVFIRSDNPQQLTCDGHGACLRLGLPLIDMEFIQFFPLGVAEPRKPNFMIPFTKGRLVNRSGEDIVVKYGLESLSRAIVFNRDKLSRYIMLEVLNGNGIDGALHLHPEEGADELSAYASELKRRLSLKPPIRVLPTAHFSMGGVEVDDSLKTPIHGLYVAGELVGGIHGASRLGGNALTACVVTAEKVAENVLAHVKSEPQSVNESVGEGIKEVLERYEFRDGKYSPSEVRDRIRGVMWSKVGIVRSEELLREGIEELLEVHENLEMIRITGFGEVIKYSEMLNTLLTSLAVAYSALARRESRGAHFRLDYPEEESHWVKNIRISYKNDRFSCEIL
jgi:succinate dehydrogenase/fumarate reductase flavoprotein subunit